jgi:hypothetical protein
MIKTFFHYSTKIKKIKQSKCIKDVSFSKTNTYDIVLEICPDLLLDRNEVRKFNEYRRKNRSIIRRYEKEQRNNSYESKYRELKLKYKNRLLNEFFNQNKFVLSFDEILPKGWIKWGMFALLINKIGNSFLKFSIKGKVASKSFVLEQKYWSPLFSKDKFGVNIWKPGFKIWCYPKIVRETFGSYYKSIKRVSDYKRHDFEVPEFWISGEIPFNSCKIGHITDDIFNRFLKDRKRLKKI